MRLFGLGRGKGRQAAAGTARGSLSRTTELKPFRDAQHEAWKGIFQQQHSHCWDAKMQHGWRATLLSNFSQRAGISSGVMFDSSVTGEGLLPLFLRQGDAGGDRLLL